MEYLIDIGIRIGLYIILAQSFNLTFGLGGLFNLSHIACYAVGAYTTALLSTELEVPFLQCALSSMLLCALFSLLIGAISLRLERDYFAIGTLAFSSVVTALLINWKSLTKGVLGIPGIPRPSIELLHWDFQESNAFLLLVVICAMLSQVVLWLCFRSPFARTLKSQAEFEAGAQSLGKNTRLARNMGFVISSALAGLAGCLFAYYLNYIDPSSFSLSEMIFVLTVVVVARPGSFWGVLWSAAFLILLGESMRFIPFSPGVLGPMRQLIYALVLFGFVWVNRARLFPPERRV